MDSDPLELPLEPVESPTLGDPLLAVRLPGRPRPVERTVDRGRIVPSGEYARWLTRVVRGLERHRHREDLPTVSTFVWAGVVVVYPRPATWAPQFRIRPAKYRAGERSAMIPNPFGGRSHPGRYQCGAGADVDNLWKGPIDALTASGLLLDDRLIVWGWCRKFYTAEGEAPCVEVRLWSAA